jgi:two-component system sensor histidine kinase YesM
LNKKTIAVGRLIKDEFMKDCGIVIISISESEIYKLLKGNSIDEYNNRFIMNRDFDIISQLNEKILIEDFEKHQAFIEMLYDKDHDVSTYKIEGENMVINYQTIDPMKWKIIEVIPYELMFKEMNLVRRMEIILYVLMFTTHMIIIYIYIKMLISPIKALEKSMKKVQDGNLDERYKISSNDEIGMLGNSFNKMVENLKVLIDENIQKQRELYEKEKIKKDLKYAVLQSQINPHFLFNTLNSIKWMALLNDAPKVANAITYLGNLLEISIKRAEDEILVSEELSYLEDYIGIMRLIYADNFHVDFEVDKNILDENILKFTLQPLVENAIIHGIFGVKKAGMIKIVGYRNGDMLIFEVNDNGIGISEELCDKLLNINTETDRSYNKFNSIGINSINERIKYFYGEAYGLEIKSSKNVGTSVIVKLPSNVTVRQSV